MRTGEKTGTCPVCGTDTRRKYTPGKGKNARLQHPRWHVCEKGHSIVRKRGQAG